MKRKGSANKAVGKVKWHSLDDDGEIKLYDVQWPDGVVETNIPDRELDMMFSEQHENEGHQTSDTPVKERKYKK